MLDTRANIRKWRGEKAKRIAAEAMSLSTAAGVEGYLKAHLFGRPAAQLKTTKGLLS